MPKLDYAYRIGDFFEQCSLHTDGSDMGIVNHIQQSFDIEVINHAQLRIDYDLTLYPHVEIRNIEINQYADHSAKILITSSLLGKEDFFQWFNKRITAYNLTDEDYHLYSPDKQSSKLCLRTRNSFAALLTILKGKLSPDIFTDLERIIHFINNESDEKFPPCHRMPKRDFFYDYKNSTVTSKLFGFINNINEDFFHRSSLYLGLTKEFATWDLLPPTNTSEGDLIRLQRTFCGRKDIYYLVCEKNRPSFHFLKAYGHSDPFKAYSPSIEKKFFPVQTYNLDKVGVYKKNADGEYFPTSYLFTKRTGSWEVASQEKLNYLFPIIPAIPVKEFDWQLTQEALNPYQCDLQGNSLIQHAVNNADLDNSLNCFWALIAYGLNPFQSSKFNLITPFEKAKHHLEQPLPNSTLRSTNMPYARYTMNSIISTYAVWKELASQMLRFSTLKKPRLILDKPKIDIQLSFDNEEIHTDFIIPGQESIHTVLKPASKLTSDEKKQLSDINEICFKALITSEEKLAFLTAAKTTLATLKKLTPSPSQIKEAKENLWVNLVETRFKIKLSTPEEKKSFLDLFSNNEKEVFSQLLEEACRDRNTSDFWSFVNKSLVRYSFYQDITGENKLIELVYKKGEMIAGSVRALYLSRNKSRIIWQGVLTAKRPAEPGSEPRGFMQFLAMRGPFSIGLFSDINQIPYEILVVIVTLNTNSHKFFEALDDYYPKYRSKRMDKMMHEAMHAIYQGKNTLSEDGVVVRLKENIQAAQIFEDNYNAHDRLFKKLAGTDMAILDEQFYAILAGFLVTPKNAEKLNQLLSNETYLQHLSSFSKALMPLVENIIKPAQQIQAKL